MNEAFAPDKPTTRAGKDSLLAGQPQSTNIASPPIKSRTFSRLPRALDGPENDRLQGSRMAPKKEPKEAGK